MPYTRSPGRFYSLHSLSLLEAMAWSPVLTLFVIGMGTSGLMYEMSSKQMLITCLFFPSFFFLLPLLSESAEMSFTFSFVNRCASRISCIRPQNDDTIQNWSQNYPKIEEGDHQRCFVSHAMLLFSEFGLLKEKKIRCGIWRKKKPSGLFRS